MKKKIAIIGSSDISGSVRSLEEDKLRLLKLKENNLANPITFDRPSTRLERRREERNQTKFFR